MNINRSNNRRRGRGNNRGPGGGNQTNRIDNRARGNAPQMLEKYKKLAHDASLNDDRVQTEYYLQFADHYFRVIADSKAQKDEQRPRRDDSTDDQDDEDERDNRTYDNRTHDSRTHDNRASGGRDQEDRPPSQPRPPRERRPQGEPRATTDSSRSNEGNQADSAESENPFVRDARPAKPRGRPRRKSAEEDSGAKPAHDPERLPPSIARTEGDGGQAEDGEAPGKTRGRSAAAKTPRATKRRAASAEDGDAEAFKAAS